MNWLLQRVVLRHDHTKELIVEVSNLVIIASSLSDVVIYSPTILSVVAKLKEAVQLWDHGLKESKQKLIWAVEDLDRYVQENLDHPDVTPQLRGSAKDIVAKGKAQLKDRLDAHLHH